MPTLYLDLAAGISGDMFLGACLDLGAPFARLRTDLGVLGLQGYHIHAAPGTKCGIRGTKFDVHEDHGHEHSHPHPHHHAHPHENSHSHSHAHHHHHHHQHEHGHAEEHAHHAHGRTHAEIQSLIQKSPLEPWVRDKALAVFQRIATAEGKIHGVPADQVHFHEVGAIDSIVDIVGACIALNLLGRPRVLASPVVEGTGFVRCAHGRLPLPAPATLEILAARGIPVTQCEESHEMVTPTGAALLAEFAEHFAPLTGFAPTKVGYGVGTRDHRTRPNILRVALGDTPAAAPGEGPDWETDTVTVLETNIDDMSPEWLGHVFERAFAAGALDVFHTPVQMKKHRPGTLLTVLCPPAAAEALSELILTETTAFGVRETVAARRKLRRESRPVGTAFGDISVKLGMLRGKAVQVAPEYESCRAAALSAGVPLKVVYAAALEAARGLTHP